MENLVVTLDTAKRLGAAGFPMPTNLGWSLFDGPKKPFITFLPGKSKFEALDYLFPAPTAQEIADQLLFSRLHGRADGSFDALATTKDAGRYPHDWVHAATMAEALALVWLKIHEAKP